MLVSQSVIASSTLSMLVAPLGFVTRGRSSFCTIILSSLIGSASLRQASSPLCLGTLPRELLTVVSDTNGLSKAQN